MTNTPTLARPRAILFDWDNTLADGWAAVATGLNAAFDAFGLPNWTVADTKARARRSMRESFPPIFGDQWQKAVEIFQVAYAEAQLANVQKMPGVDALLEAAQPYPCAVVSNKDGHFVRREASVLGLTKYFTTIIGAGDAERDKPDPAPFELALSASGLRPGPDIWYVGDTGLDMQAAHECGFIAVLLGDAAHDGGVKALQNGNFAPHAHFIDANIMAAWLKMLA